MITIRYATINDAKDLGRIHAASWKAAYKGIIPDQILDGITKEKRQAYFEQVLAEGNQENALIFLDNVAAGFICIGKCRDKDKDSTFGEIGGLYLSPEYYGSGLGTKLIQWGFDELKKRGYKKVTLWVLEENQSARRFYKKMGLELDGTIQKIKLGKPLNEVRYEKALD